MKAACMMVAEKPVVVLVPDALQEEKKLQALWLIPPKGEDAAVWANNTKVEKYAENAKAILVCTPWEEQDTFYTETLWSALHEHFSALSDEPNDHRLLGMADSAERCLKFVFRYPERFNIAVAVCPASSDDCMELLGLIKDFAANRKKCPRTVISDCAEGDGERMGNAINKYGVDMHVHANRTLSGWALMDAEIKSCLAHL